MYGIIVGAALCTTLGAMLAHKQAWFLTALVLLILALLCSPL